MFLVFPHLCAPQDRFSHPKTEGFLLEILPLYLLYLGL